MQTDLPLVTCILPTQGRPRFINHAINFFMDQSYPNKELYVLYSDKSDIPQKINQYPNVYMVCTGNISLGAKRNYLMHTANGYFIAQWDDDDIYHPDRLWKQITPLLNDEAEITGLNNILFFDALKKQCYSCSHPKFRSMFDGNVACGTMVFRKNIWGIVAEYPDFSSAEDGFFIRQALNNGARLKEVDGRDLYVYVRHRRNTWRFNSNYLRNRADYNPTKTPFWIERYKNFYLDKSLFL